MNWKTWAPLILAVVFAVLAAKAVHDWMLKNQRAAAPAGHLGKVVVTKADVPPGKQLAAEDLALPVPSTDALYVALTAAVNTLGPAGIADITPTFEGLDADPVEWPEVAICHRFAYRHGRLVQALDEADVVAGAIEAERSQRALDVRP